MTRLHPDLKFSEIHNDSMQILNYSGNWDFDNDGKKDSLYFVGIGGAHLYYYLRLILSSDKRVRNFPWLLLDLPSLATTEQVGNVGKAIGPYFMVYDFDGDGIDEVFLNFDIGFSEIPLKWRKRGVTSRYLLLKHEKNDISIRDFRKR